MRATTFSVFSVLALASFIAHVDARALPNEVIGEECVTGSFQCYNETVRQCNHGRWVEIADCGAQNLVCLESDYECVPHDSPFLTTTSTYSTCPTETVTKYKKKTLTETTTDYATVTETVTETETATGTVTDCKKTVTETETDTETATETFTKCKKTITETATETTTDYDTVTETETATETFTKCKKTITETVTETPYPVVTTITQTETQTETETETETGYPSTVTKTETETETETVTGTCTPTPTPHKCVDNEFRCLGKKVQQCAFGKWVTIATCAKDQFCLKNDYECVPISRWGEFYPFPYPTESVDTVQPLDEE